MLHCVSDASLTTLLAYASLTQCNRPIVECRREMLHSLDGTTRHVGDTLVEGPPGSPETPIDSEPEEQAEIFVAEAT